MDFLMRRTPRQSTVVHCRTPGQAHALRHELDQEGALSRRRGSSVYTSASAAKIRAAKKRARFSVHHGSSR